jgi:hypothetical protein
MPTTLTTILPLLAVLGSSSEAAAQSTTATVATATAATIEKTALTEEAPPATEGTIEPSTGASVVLTGYAEAFYQWNFNDPSNDITNFRGFDNRHNSFTIANAVIDAFGTLGPVSVRLALQFGHTAETYYLAEPLSPGAGGAATTGASVWKFLQQVNVGYQAPLGAGLSIEAGIFLSPVGPEGLAIKDQWNWSRSNLFFGLPFYHTGLKLSYPLTDRLMLMIMGCNGWNSVVDNNAAKSIAVELGYAITDTIVSHILYFGGIERPAGAPEGKPWRNLIDAYVTWSVTSWLSLNLHGDVGFEPNDFGTSYWVAGALSLRVQPVSWLYLAVRGDFFYEKVASNADGAASAIFWPAKWVSSPTVTVDLRPVDNVSMRLEYRHDQAEAAMFFKDHVETDDAGTFALGAESQDTLTLGMTAWF